MRKFVLPVLVVVLASLLQLSSQIPAASIPPAAVISFQAARMTRFHHNTFHQTRMWFNGLTQKEQYDVARLGWAPPRVVNAILSDGSSVTINGDGGEDFLFMHRRMIAKVNKIAADAGSSWRVDGWTVCPPPGDADWPVPAAYVIPGDDAYTQMIAEMKSNDFYTNSIVPLENQLNDPVYLRTLTLGELGLKLELEIHTWFHVRFSAASPTYGYRVQSYHPTAYIGTEWDAEEYDWLSDFYSAHVNPHFWKIHGWIERKITNWQNAHSLTSLHWLGTWETGPMEVVDDLALVAAESQAMREAEKIKPKSTRAGAILGSLLGGLTLIYAFVIVLTLIFKKNTSSNVHAKTSSEAPQKVSA